jgi:IS605 OrfB family transposase
MPQASRKTGVYKDLMERMLAFRNLQNTYIKVLVTALQDGQLKIPDFSGESKAHVKGRIYNELNLNAIYLSHPAAITLKERMLRCAIHYPYFTVREWLVRSHYLSVILQELVRLITHSPRLAVSFLKSNQPSHAIMKLLSRALSENVFGTRVSLSYDYIQNLMGQARNLFLANSSLEVLLCPRIKEILNNSAVIDSFTGNILRSFTRKRNGRRVKLPVPELLSYFSKIYVSQVKRKSSWRAKYVEKHSNMKKFKKERDRSFTPLEESLKEHVKGLSDEFTCNLMKEILFELLDNSLKSLTHPLTKQVFKPVHQSPPVELIISVEGFNDYFTQVLRNQLNRKLNELFFTTSIINGTIADLRHLENNLTQLLPPPRIKRLAVPINQEESVYHPDFNKLTVRLSFLSREWFDLDIKDDKGRIKRLIDGGATTCLPVITMKGRKLLLHLPLELNSSDLSCQTPECLSVPQKCIELGGDLGLKHPAVLSVMDRSDPDKPVEIGRYFLSMKLLLDMNFNPVLGKFEKKARFLNAHSNKNSNMKHSLRNVRSEARILQRKIHEYENRLMERQYMSAKNKYKHYRLQRDLSQVWERVNRINREVVRQLGHAIIAIAEYHGASVMKFENLKWSQHSKKKNIGRWLSFWQVHWFFSQVQQAVEFQANLKGIAFRRVRADYTSQDCWECHARGTREGRSFTCSNAKHHKSGKLVQIHSDLNAARVIALS